jgi:hypothetical protein
MNTAAGGSWQRVPNRPPLAHSMSNPLWDRSTLDSASGAAGSSTTFIWVFPLSVYV